MFDRDLGFEFNFKSSDRVTKFNTVTFENSTTGYVDYNLIDGFLDDHHQTGRTNIDVSIAEINHYHLKYTCSLQKGIATKKKPDVSNTNYLDCW